MFRYLAVIIFLPLVSQNRANHSAGIFDHHLSSLDVPLAEKAATVNVRPARISEQLNTVQCI